MKSEEKKSARRAIEANRQALGSVVEKKRSEICDYAFTRLKHPDKDLITKDSLLKSLNDLNIQISLQKGS